MKSDLIIKDNQVFVIECVPRLGGGKLSSEMFYLSMGIDYWKIALKLAMGITIDPEELQPKWYKYVAQRYKFPDNPTSHRDRITDVIKEGVNYDDAVASAERAISELSLS